MSENATGRNQGALRGDSFRNRPQLPVRALLHATCAVGLSIALTACASQDVCNDYIYKDAGSKRNSSESESRRCKRPVNVGQESEGYVIDGGQIYFVESDSSTIGTCVANMGSYSSAGRSLCPLGTTTYSITTNHYYPLQRKPRPADIRLLAEEYAATKSTVYYKQFVIPDAHPLGAGHDLRVLPRPASSLDSPGASPALSDYATYGEQVFYQGMLVEGADAYSLRALLFEHHDETKYEYFMTELARDGSRAFWKGRMLDDSDPETLEVVDGSHIKDKEHLWRVDYSDSFDLLVKELPEDLGGGFFRMQFTSPAGARYSRVQRSEKLDDGHFALTALPLRMSEGKEFRALPAGCPVGSSSFAAHTELKCAAFPQLGATEFGRTNERVFLIDEELPGVDAASFEVISIDHYDYGGFAGAQAIDLRHMYQFHDGWHESAPIHGQLLGPIPGPYGRFLLLADSENIYDLTGWERLDSDDLCRYQGNASLSGLRVASREEGRNGAPYIVLENSLYRYVFYDSPLGKENPGHVVDLKTGKELPLARRTDQPCGAVDPASTPPR